MRVKRYDNRGEVDPDGLDKTLQYLFEESMGKVSLQDQEFKDPEDGIILTDRETGEKKRIKLVNGNLELEAAEGY